jgi:hypothetical protein
MWEREVANGGQPAVMGESRPEEPPFDYLVRVVNDPLPWILQLL